MLRSAVVQAFRFGRPPEVVESTLVDFGAMPFRHGSYESNSSGEDGKPLSPSMMEKCRAHKRVTTESKNCESW